jgi:hypothetical protein
LFLLFMLCFCFEMQKYETHREAYKNT